MGRRTRSLELGSNGWCCATGGSTGMAARMYKTYNARETGGVCMSHRSRTVRRSLVHVPLHIPLHAIPLSAVRLALEPLRRNGLDGLCRSRRSFRQSTSMNEERLHYGSKKGR